MRRLMIIAAALLLAVAPAAQGAWHIETVGEGSGPSLTLDSEDRPHVSHNGFRTVRYTRWGGSYWLSEVVVHDSFWGLSTLLALDSADNPHIVYKSWGNLGYASWDGLAWKIYEYSNDAVTSFPTMALNSDGYIHLAYNEWVSGTEFYLLKHTRWDGIDWQSETVDIAYHSNYISLALDSSDYPHIAYTGIGCLKYARWDGTEWHIEVVDSMGWRRPSLVLDSADRPHIAYCFGSYAHWDGYDWQLITIVDDSSGGWWSYKPSIAVDSAGMPHIAYWYERQVGYYDTEHTLYYFDGSRWTRETILTIEENYCLTLSLVLDTDDRPHIMYNEKFKGVRYARRPDNWNVDGVELAAAGSDNGVLVSWTIDGETPLATRLLRGEESPIVISGDIPGHLTSFLDMNVEAGNAYTYWLEVVEQGGAVKRFGPTEARVPEAQRSLTLHQPWPSPARDFLTVAFELSESSTIGLHVYDLAGRRVATLASGEHTAGRHELSWDCAGQLPGVYLLRLETAANTLTRRVAITR